jgi:hypothetical protein
MATPLPASSYIGNSGRLFSTTFGRNQQSILPIFLVASALHKAYLMQRESFLLKALP